MGLTNVLQRLPGGSEVIPGRLPPRMEMGTGLLCTLQSLS